MQYHINVDKVSGCAVGISAGISDVYDQVEITEDQALSILTGQCSMDSVMSALGRSKPIPIGPVDVTTLPILQNGDLEFGSNNMCTLRRLAGVPSESASENVYMTIKKRDNPHVIDPIWFTADNGYIAFLPNYFNHKDYVLISSGLISTISYRTDDE